MASSNGVRVGERAPDFTLPSTDGKQVSLSDFRGRAEVVLFFYPKDDSPACTAQVCSFRDSYDVFREAGAEVIGVSSDSVESHQNFANRHRLPFLLMSDADGALRARFGVPKTLGLIPGRVTYLIDKQGIVRHVFSSQIRLGRHIREMLGILHEIRHAR